MQGILSAAQHRDLLAPVEKGIAGGTVADPLALQRSQTRDAGHSPGSAGGQDHRICGPLTVQRLHGKAVGIGDAHRLGLNKLHTHGFGALDAPAGQLCPGDRLSKAIVILDPLRPLQRTGAFGKDGGLHPCTGSIQSGRHTCRARTNNNDLGHRNLLRRRCRSISSPSCGQSIGLTVLLYTISGVFP